MQSFCPRPLPVQNPALQVLKRDAEWVEKDMKDAGKADHESDDWVAEDMERLGAAQEGDEGWSKVGWVAKDMLKSGQARTHPPQKKREDPEKKNWDIAKDMKSVGKSVDWIAKDMEEAGHADSRSKFTTEHWLNKLDVELDKDKETRKNIKKDMEETGRMGSDSSVQVRHDMEMTGKAQNPYEAIQGYFHDISYKLSEWTQKAFNVDEIMKDMQEAGGKDHPDQTALTHDMETTGRRGSDHGGKLADQKNELKEDLTEADHEKYVAKDMLREGKPDGFHTRTEHKRTRLIYDDMMLAGGSYSQEKVRQDMETAGHAENSFSSKNMSNQSQYKQELEAFKSTPHAKAKAPVEAGKDKKEHAYEPWNKKAKSTEETKAVTLDDELSFFEEETEELDDSEEAPRQGFVKHLFKKALHPRTPWKDL